MRGVEEKSTQQTHRITEEKKHSEMLEMKNHRKSNKNSMESLSSRITEERSEYLSLKTIVEGRAQSNKTKDETLIYQ